MSPTTTITLTLTINLDTTRALQASDDSTEPTTTASTFGVLLNTLIAELANVLSRYD
jgi:hypothetical protein